MIGKTISHYKILEKLGEGGMGVVYKAEDTKLKRTVALKFLPPELTRTTETRERFIREAQAASQLDHPHICTVHEIEEAEGQTFIALSYIDGQTLAQKIMSGPFDVEEAAVIAIQVAEGLHEAHKKGIIHRDIKSANIMLDSTSRARIMDFGLAKLAGKTKLTSAVTVMGTVAYMSPERAHGETDVDHRTDVWSLGIVLYEMLTGKLPFDAPTDIGLIHKIIYENPEPMTALRSNIPTSLESVVEKMMQKAPQDRYDDMKGVIADLSSVVSGTTPSTVSKEEITPSIAILPFVDMSPQHDQEHLCDGLSEEIINALTRLGDLKVIARTSSFSFRDQSLDACDIGRKLAVDTVLEGSVCKTGNELRITAQLIRVRDGFHLWSEEFNREPEDIFVTRDEMTSAVADRLKPSLRKEERAKLVNRQTIDLEAYNLYLRGRYFMHELAEDALGKAIECFKQAIEWTPVYASAYAGLARCYSDLPIRSFFPSKEAYSMARAAALKALEIDDKIAEAHSVLAHLKSYHEWEWDGAEREFKRAIELDPGSGLYHRMYAWYQVIMTRFDEAIKEAKQGLELDPISLIANEILGEVYLYARKYDEAIEALRKTAEMDPDFLFVRAPLGFAYLQKKMYEEALEETQKGKTLSAHVNKANEAWTGIAHSMVGNRNEARRVLDHLLDQLKYGYVPPALLAYLYLGLGENDQGFGWLEEAYQERDYWLFSLRVHPVFDNIRSDSRYSALLKKMNLDE
jgi:serine/threonine-protein kinase